MIRRLYQRLYSEQVAGLEVMMLPEEQMVINGVTLSRKGEMVSTVASFTNVGELAALLTHLPVTTPVSLVLSGRGVLCKRQECPDGHSGQLLQKILPNAKESDFYIQSIPSGGYVLAAVARRGSVDSMVALISELGYRVINVVLVPVAFDALKSLLGNEVLQEKGSLSLTHHQVSFATGELTDYTFKECKGEPESDQVALGGANVAEQILPAYGAALHALIPELAGQMALPVGTAEAQLDEYLQKRRFIHAGYAALCFFLLLLLANAWFYRHYANEYQRLEYRYAGLKKESEEADTLRKQIAAQEAFLKQTGWFRLGAISYYVDRIGSTVPQSIRIEELVINPPDDKRSKSEKTMHFEFEKGKIGGHCGSPTDLNRWVRQLRDLDWLRNVEIHQYSFDEKINGGQFLITFEIQ
nr:hypothetical protein [uncultured Dyadobacter sp.]